MPEYAVKHEGIMVLFKASKPSKAPKHQAAALDEALDEALEKEIIEIIKESPQIKQNELAEKL